MTFKRRTFFKKKNIAVTLDDFESRIQTVAIKWYAERVLWYLRRAHASGIFENPTGTSLRAWRYDITGNKVRFFNRKDYVFFLNRGRKSQAMTWLEGKTIPLMIGGRLVFRTAKNVGRPNKNSKHGRLFYMKQPDKGKPYLGYIEDSIDRANRALKEKLKRGFSARELREAGRQ